VGSGSAPRSGRGCWPGCEEQALEVLAPNAATGWWMPVTTTTAQAQAALAQHRGDPHEAARLFERAAQEYAPSGATLWQAYALLLATPQAQAAGDTRGAVVLWRRAHRLLGDGGARLLSDLAVMVRPQVEEAASGEPPTELDQLTGRGREIADLVAEGLSNQAIATKLFLSTRTVESHLSAIHRKTGLPSRSALAGLVTRAALEQRPAPAREPLFFATGRSPGDRV
jgi:DNA-binding NarL/FixJ family response regulator